MDQPCASCIAELGTMPDRLAAMREAVAQEREPIVTLTHLLKLCRADHAALWERVGDPECRNRVTAILAPVRQAMPAGQTPQLLDRKVRQALVAALEPDAEVPAVVIAHALAELLDLRYSHTFTPWFARRSPYRPGVGDPLPLDGPDLRAAVEMAPTSPPWRLAQRLDETRRVRLAGEWAVQFRIVFDYALANTLADIISADTVLATCHPNRSLDEFTLPTEANQPAFPVHPIDLDRQHTEINRLIAQATAAHASIIVLPELCLTETMAAQLQEWVRRPGGPRLLVAGSYHHEDDHGDTALPHRRRNTAIAWVRGHDRPLTHDKHSPADRPVLEDIQPQGWPELRVYVTRDGCHLVIAICRDLLNPNAVYALTEVGVNLALVPAMSESLVSFGGPAANLVGSGQAIVAVANNPAHWPSRGDGAARRAARALFGHPSWDRQTQPVHTPGDDPGVAVLHVHSGDVRWLAATDYRDNPYRFAPHSDATTSPRSSVTPAWVPHLTAAADQRRPWTRRAHIVLRPAAVLVLLTDGPTGPRVLLTERATQLANYPGQLVFPGGATQADDDSPVATALREAREETGLAPHTVEIIGMLPPIALPETGFIVDPVLAWSAAPTFPGAMNRAEVTTITQIGLAELTGKTNESKPAGHDSVRGAMGEAGLGTMTTAVIDVLCAALARSDPIHPPDQA